MARTFAVASMPCSLWAGAQHCDPMQPGLFPFLRDNAEHVGLRPIAHDGCCFTGLNESLLAFHNQSTLLFGDSTTFEVAIGLELLLRFLHYRKAYIIADASASDLFNASFAFLMQFKRKKEIHHGLSYSTHSRENTKLAFANPQGATGRYTGHACNIVQQLGETLRWANPSILFINWAAHWYHTIGFGTFLPAACVVRHWLSYETFVEDLIRSAHAANVSRIFWKSSSRVCPGQWTMDESIAWQHYYDADASNASLYAPCEAQLLSDGYGFTPDESRHYCWNATFTDHGAHVLNLRARAAIAKVQIELPSVSVHYFDDRALQRCDLAYNMSIHHNREDLLMRIRALGNQLSSTLSRADRHVGH